MGWRDRARRTLSAWRVRVADTVVSALTRQPIRTDPGEGTQFTYEARVVETPIVVAPAEPPPAEPSPAKSPPAETVAAPTRSGRINAMARDPRTAFVHWSYSESRPGELRWLAAERTVRIEEVELSKGRCYVPFALADTPHVAILAVRTDDGVSELLRSNPVIAPEEAPRAPGPAHMVRPDDPNLTALGEAQRKARENLVRPRRAGPRTNATSS